MFKFSYLDIINEVANSIHDYIQEVYGFPVVQKTVVSEKYKVKGRIDAYKDDILYEIKTVEEDKFSGHYIPDHYNQGLVYSYILNSEYQYNIHTISIVYVMRNNVRKIIPFDIPIDNELAKKYLERSPRLLGHITRKAVPDPIAAIKEHCDFCPYIKYCKEDPATIAKPFEINKYEKYEKKIDEYVSQKPVFLL
jgi:CRISPR/Cas system-associated exonuclease Cas4 (RecB family)